VLAAEFVQRGGRLVTDAGRCTLLTDSGAVTGVRTGSGEDFRASVTLLATGAAVPAMGAEVGLDIPDATVPALLVTTVPVRVGLKAVLNTPRASLRPTPAGALAVDSDWTAPHISQTDDGGYQVTRDLAEELLAEASRLLAGHPRLAADRCAIGSKPIPADGEPVLGGVEQVPGLSLAFTHSGATLGLIVAELLTYEITSGRPHPMLADFNVRRFR